MVLVGGGNIITPRVPTSHFYSFIYVWKMTLNCFLNLSAGDRMMGAVVTCNSSYIYFIIYMAGIAYMNYDYENHNYKKIALKYPQFNTKTIFWVKNTPQYNLKKLHFLNISHKTPTKCFA